MKIKKTTVFKILDEITELLDEVDQTFNKTGDLYVYPDGTPGIIVTDCIKESFEKILFLLESMGQDKTYEKVDDLYKAAQADMHGFIKMEWGIDEPYLVWPSQLRTYLNLIKGMVNYPERKNKKKLLPSQKARIKCKEVAKKLIEQNPKMTIADSIRHEDMKNVSKRKDGNPYTEKTIRNWIKDLWPDEQRTPGRRKGT